MARIGSELLAEAKQVQGASESNDNAGAKDLLSLLVKSNTNSHVTESQRMSDEDVLARTYLMVVILLWIGGMLTISTVEVPTFLVAGHETTRWKISLSLV